MTTTPLEKLAQDTENTEPRSIEFASDPGDYIRKPTADTDTEVGEGGMLVSDLESAGWTIVYHTVTREPSTINNNMLPAQMAEKLPDGSPVFTKEKPTEPPWRGSFLCFLHEDHPDRATYAAMGFDTCSKATIPSEYEALQHAQNRHTKQWEAVKLQNEEAEHREDRELNRATLNALSRAAGVQVETPAPVAQAVETTATPGPATFEVGKCELCDFQAKGKTEASAASGLRLHIRGKHSGEDS